MAFVLKRTVAPSGYVLSEEAALEYLRVIDAKKTAKVLRVLRAATTWCENRTGRAFLTSTWRFSISRFPTFDLGSQGYIDNRGYDNCDPSYPYFRGRLVELPRAPLQSLTSISYVDTSGATQVLSPAAYKVDADSEPGRVAEAFGLTWPVARQELNAVQFLYVAGYGAASAVPEDLVQAVVMLAAHWWERRTPVVFGSVASKVQLAVEDILLPYRIKKYR